MLSLNKPTVMEATNIEDIKLGLMHWIKNSHDFEKLKKLYDVIYKEDPFPELTEAQKAELQSLMEEYKSGKMKFYSWEEVKTSLGK
jgi:putative addiction module component (TIGR02574 family)